MEKKVSDWAYREEEGQAVLRLLNEHPGECVAVDTEDTGLNVYDGEDMLIGVSIAAVIDGEPVSHYFPVAHPTGDAINAKTFEMLRHVLTDGRELIFANYQYDAAALLFCGIDLLAPKIPFYDIQTMANLVNENKPKTKSLEEIAKHYLGPDSVKVDTPEIAKEKKTGWKNTTAKDIWDYAVVDAELTYGSWFELINHPNWIDLRENTTVWDDKQQLIRILLEMRMRGVMLDFELTTELEAIGRAHMAELREQMGFNPGSNAQLAEVMIDTLGLPVLKRSPKTGKPSFDKSVMPLYDELLEQLDNPLAKQLMEYRGWQKATTASYTAYLEARRPDGAIRCSFNTHRTVTGRLSSSEPNLQQVPKVTDKPWNGKVKDCFVARPGYVLLSADYSQLELRLAVAYSGEPSLVQVFEEGRDIFTEMSTELGMTRGDTKTFVYSTQYGGGDKRISTVFKVPMAKARKMRMNYYATYPRFRAFNEACQHRAETTMRCKLWSGRYRHFQFKSEAFKAMNSVIQGGAADIVEKVMIRAWNELESDDCHMLLQVHDALVFEVREDLADEYSARIKELMEDVNGAVGQDLFNVKFNVEVTGWSEK